MSNYYDDDNDDNEDDDDQQQNNGGAGGGIIGLIIVIALCVWGYSHFIKHDYSKPWWKGSESQQLCTTGDTQKCYTLVMSSDGESITNISFPNGGYLYGTTECYKAASIYDYDKFCRFFDQENRRWDVLPLGAHIQ